MHNGDPIIVGDGVNKKKLIICGHVHKVLFPFGPQKICVFFQLFFEDSSYVYLHMSETYNCKWKDKFALT